MTYQPVVFDRFPGLRLLPEQGEAQGSITMLNAEIVRDLTQVSSRGGLSLLGTGTGSYHRIAPLDSSNLSVFRNTGSVLEASSVALSTDVVSASATTWGNSSTRVTSTQQANVGGVQFAVVASRSGATNEGLRLNTGALLSSLGITASSPRFVANTGFDGRAAQAHFTSAGGAPGGANGSASTIFFSGAGSYLTWGATDYVTLDPNDGDEITGVATWRGATYVVKRKSLFVFYGTSVDSTGGAVFNYRQIGLPARVRYTANGGGENIVAGSDGIYLLLSDGVYRTTGDVPTMVSRSITPLFDGTGDSATVLPANADWTLGYAANRVYLTYPRVVLPGTYRTLVYDTILGEWLLWDLSAGQSFQPSNVTEWVDQYGTPAVYIAAGAKILSLTRTATTDGGTSITSNYQYGFDSLGSPAQKRVRQTHLWGSGSPTWSLFTDYGSTDSQAATVTLGTAPAISEGYDRGARRGKMFSFKISDSAPWVLTRAVLDVAGQRDEGSKT